MAVSRINFRLTTSENGQRTTRENTREILYPSLSCVFAISDCLDSLTRDFVTHNELTIAFQQDETKDASLRNALLDALFITHTFLDNKKRIKKTRRIFYRLLS